MTRRHRTLLLRILAAGAVGIWLVAGGWKSVREQFDPEPSPSPTPPLPLERQWTRQQSGADRMPAVAWSTRRTVVLRYGDTLRGHRLSDGRQVWQRPLPPGADGICGISPTAGPDAVGAVHYSLRGQGCTRLDVLAADTGSEHWSRTVAQPPGRDWLPPVVGAREVVLGAREGDTRRSHVLRFRVDDGRALPALRPGAGCALDSAAYSTGRVALVESCGGDARISVYADGRRLWHRPAPPGTLVEAVVADEPLTLLLDTDTDTGTDTGDRRMQVYGAGGGTGVRLVDAVDSRDWAPLHNYWHLDGTHLAVRTNAGVVAYDLATRRQLWTYTRDPVAGLLGADAGRAVVAGCPASRYSYPCFTAIRLSDGEPSLAGTLPEVAPPHDRPQTAFHLLPESRMMLMVQRTDDGENVRLSAYQLSRP